MAVLVTITKGIKVTQVVAGNAVPQVEVAPATLIIIIIMNFI